MANKHLDWLVVKSKPKSHISEAYRILMTNIEFSNLDKPINTILVTSAVPQKGKITNIANLALTFAKSGKKAIIVDSDLRLPLIHKVFNRDKIPGLSNVLVNDKRIPEVIKRADDIHSNLYFIPSGPIPPNPSELLGSGRMEAVIKELRDQADMVIFNSPPVIGFTETVALANQVDGVVLFLNAGMITRDIAKQAKALLEKVKAKILGVVLNDVDTKKEGYYQYYHNYDYSKYYNHNTNE